MSTYIDWYSVFVFSVIHIVTHMPNNNNTTVCFSDNIFQFVSYINSIYEELETNCR